MLAAVQFPTWIHPEILPFLPQFPLRWYGLMYLVAFGITYLLFKYQVKERGLGYSADDISGFFLAGIVGLIIGARLFGTLLYDPSGIYWRKPWLIFWPFGEGGRFTGFMGMSFHGGFIGAVVGFFIYAKRTRLDFLEWADMIAVSVPLGYTFGRLGNFINAELWGKVSAAPWAMVFPRADRFPASQAWVRDIAQKAGIALDGAMINLPRHPSQLYEALFEGVILWLVLWFAVRPRKTFKGFAVGAYIAGYGLVRFFIEYFREPDADLGYIIRLGDPSASIHVYSTPLNFSMGQILCALMIVGGLGFIAVMGRSSRRRASLLAAAEAERSKIQSAKKKLRKR
ncbi:MAG: prolipoprotein diacylglyceryl transferase [Spirochaetes bacterium]|nr:prolipoprotein diacylglyceryl transferase [Spirochaetota bacterium]MBU1082127.1 prolipoprotein diacylglyceryl transferase [Spirochaetota bacterium]